MRLLLPLLLVVACDDEKGDSAPTPGDSVPVDSVRPETGDSDRPETGDSTQPDTGDSTRPETGDSHRSETGDTSARETADSAAPIGPWSWGDDVAVEDAQASFVGEEAGGWAGGHVHVVGDMDGDGFGDIAIGDPEYEEDLAGDLGKVYFAWGRSRGWRLGEHLRTKPSVVGAYDDMQLSQTTPVGDLNGDGLADVGIRCGFSYGPHRGVYLVLGRTSGWKSSVSSEDVDAVAYNEHADGSTDLSVNEYLGDMDGDGLDDWLMTGPVIHDGEAMVVSGATALGDLEVPSDAALWIYGEPEGDVDFAAAGDVNGDGLADLEGQYDDDPAASHAYLFLGRTGGLPHDAAVKDAADATILNSARRDSDLERVGDVDGDGADDLFLRVRGSTSASDAGYLFLGRDPWPVLLTEADADTLVNPGTITWAVGEVGDIDGDGCDDLVFGGYGSADMHLAVGRATWPAVLELPDVDTTIRPAGDFTQLQWVGPSSRGDINGDGVRDLVFGDEMASVDGFRWSGAAAVFVGRASLPATLTTDDADVRFVGSAEYQGVGTWDRFVVGDVNADGFDDVLVSSPGHPLGTEEGETFVFFGQEGP